MINPLAWATYWRNSLADAELATGVLPATGDNLRWLSAEKLKTGIVDSHHVSEFFKDIDPDQETIEVMIRPLVFDLKFERGKKAGNLPERVSPIVVKAHLDRRGLLYPQPVCGMARDLLEPQERAAMTIANIEDVDQELTDRPLNGFARPNTENAGQFDYDRAWTTFIAECRRLLRNTAGDWPGTDSPYRQREEWLISMLDGSGGSSLHILPIYDHMRSTQTVPPLFAQYAGEVDHPVKPRLASNAGFSTRLAHASDQYPLADAQRDSLAHFLATEAGDILAVNGPPGTGKTTLLLSVVTCLWAKAAHDGGDPPVIIATSTNNQAVTNVIDAFGKDFSTGSGPFAGRWLPDIKSFGAYFPAKKMEGEASKKYQTKEFFSALENPQYINNAHNAFLAKAAIAYPGIPAGDINAVVAQLQADIREQVAQLERINRRWNLYLQAQASLIREFGREDPAANQAERAAATANAQQHANKVDLISIEWDAYLGNESAYFSFLSWIGPINRKRMAKARQFLHGRWPEMALNQKESIKSIDDSIAQAIDDAKARLQAYEAKQRAGELAILQYNREFGAWHKEIAILFPNGKVPKNATLADCDLLADTQIRFLVFLLVTHYWEGRWLITMMDLLPNLSKEAGKSGKTAVVPRWHRRMMITPTVVATSYMLPNEMKVVRYENKAYANDYLYDFADLLIVDEAGQVLPEVAGASFALAKRALVIGDTLQLEPIWKLDPGIDCGNLRTTGLLDKQRSYEYLRSLGKTSAGGSVMAVAQQRSKYHYDSDFPRGMMLYEHRRCYDQIIGYCNDLCYRGKLLPKRGSAPTGNRLPTLGYLHINGRSEAKQGQSRWNVLEAETIAVWIAENRAELEEQYKKKIHEIVGVLSPFTGQVAKIIEACKGQGIPAGRGEGEITVGTVNALQGAERAVVIFSPTYSKHSDGQFIDKRQSMLNVAVSRAKDNFLVFGDMDIFNPLDRKTPRGLLAAKLFADPSNAMTFEALPRKDLCSNPTKGPLYLRDAHQHDDFLLETIKKAQSCLVIVSPWLRRQRIHEHGIYQAMVEAVRRGVSVKIYGSRRDTDDAVVGQWQACVDWFTGAGIAIADIDRLHAKIVIADENTLTIGSFNWLSAARQGQYAKHEVSVVYSGPNCAEEIEVELGWLEKKSA